MAHSGKGKVIRMMSPENYIRNKARYLPLVECLINAEWENAKIANIIIARRHSNGNLTVCLYLADLYCQGIKDTYWYFNITPVEYKKRKNEILENADFKNISYELAHNIIYTAHEFAEDCGIDSHKDFINITKFMLADDTENIEIIDIECGEDGVPVFVGSPDQSKAEAERIIARLEKNVGPGNYKIIQEMDSDYDADHEDNEDNENNEDQEDLEDQEYNDMEYKATDNEDQSKFGKLTFDEKKAVFEKLLKGEYTSPEKKEINMAKFVNFVFDDLCEEDEVALEYGKIHEDLSIPVCFYSKVPDELIGFDTDNRNDRPLLNKKFLEAFEAIANQSSKAKKQLDTFRVMAQDTPAAEYLELYFLQSTENKDFEYKLKQYADRHPDYSMLKLFIYEKNMQVAPEPEYPRLSEFFPGRSNLHRIEILHFLRLAIIFLHYTNNPSRLKALYQCLYEYEKLSDPERINMLRALMIMKFNYVRNFLSVQIPEDEVV